MKLEKAIAHLKRKARQRVFQSDPDAYKALLLSLHGLEYIKRSRTFGEYPVNRHLPGETE